MVSVKLLFQFEQIEEEFERNQRGNQNPYIEEEQTTQWPKDSVCQVNA
jgi:hypothetical protein